LGEEKPEDSFVSGHLSQREIKREMEKRKTWEVRDGDEKDLEGILSLRKIVFGEMERDKLDPRFWKWEFMEGPDGKAFIYIVEEGGRVIGHFADVPRRFSVNGEVVLGTQSLDLMVHPDYRRRGFFEEMGRYAIRRVKAENGFFLTAFPIRKETVHGLVKIGWERVVELPVLVYPIRFQGIVDRYLHFRPLSLFLGGITRFFHFLFFQHQIRSKETEGIEVDQVDQLDDGFDQFWKRVFSLCSIMGVRDRSFLNWRYFQNPARTYTIYRAMKKAEMSGYLILRKVDLLDFNSAAIVDLLAFDKETLKALVLRGIEHSYNEGTVLLGFMVPKIHPYYRDLRRWGFLPSLKTFQFMVYPIVEEGNLLNPGAWYVNWGDTDVI
jgi:GNAT superfamily N-acetyltransferase